MIFRLTGLIVFFWCLTAVFASPPEGCDGADAIIDGTSLSVRMMGLSSPEANEACRDFSGPGFTFMFLTIHNKAGVGRFIWNCTTDSLIVVLSDGRRLTNVHLMNLEGFYQWDLASYFKCSSIVYPGRIEYIYTAFQDEFSWNDIEAVYFRIKARDGYVNAEWIRRKE